MGRHVHLSYTLAIVIAGYATVSLLVFHRRCPPIPYFASVSPSVSTFCLACLVLFLPTLRPFSSSQCSEVFWQSPLLDCLAVCWPPLWPASRKVCRQVAYPAIVLDCQKVCHKWIRLDLTKCSRQQCLDNLADLDNCFDLLLYLSDISLSSSTLVCIHELA